jgi:hypothetical protein
MDFETLRKSVTDHQKERTIFANEIPSETVDKLLEEASELLQSILEAEIGGSN